MKKLFCALAALALTTLSFGQLSFGVSPGFNLNSAYLGYKTNSGLMPYVSFQKFSASGKFEYSEEVTGNYPTPDQPTSGKIKGTLLLPTLGAKYFFKSSSKVQTALNVALTKPIVWAKETQDGVNNPDINETLDELKLFGATFGFSAEYFFDANFSVSGEFGFMWIAGKYTDEYEYSGSDIEGEPYTVTEKNVIKAVFNPTYNKIGVNYYFNGGKTSKE